MSIQYHAQAVLILAGGVDRVEQRSTGEYAIRKLLSRNYLTQSASLRFTGPLPRPLVWDGGYLIFLACAAQDGYCITLRRFVSAAGVRRVNGGIIRKEAVYVDRAN